MSMIMSWKPKTEATTETKTSNSLPQTPWSRRLRLQFFQVLIFFQPAVKHSQMSRSGLETWHTGRTSSCGYESKVARRMKKRIYPSKIVIFPSYVSLPKGNNVRKTMPFAPSPSEHFYRWDSNHSQSSVVKMTWFYPH